MLITFDALKLTIGKVVEKLAYTSSEVLMVTYTSSEVLMVTYTCSEVLMVTYTS
jgi:hypothetical protein